MRKILVFDVDGKFTVEVPDDAKLTFGPAIPYPARAEQRSLGFNPGGGDRSYSLRIYKGSKENLLAVFAGVKGFRDLSLVVDIPEEEDDVLGSRAEAVPAVSNTTAPPPRQRRRRPPVNPNAIDAYYAAPIAEQGLSQMNTVMREPDPPQTDDASPRIPF